MTRIAAGTIIAEIGVDMTRLPTAAHLASWAKFAPIVSESAGKRKGKNAPARATGTWPAPWARPSWPPPEPTPSSAIATDAWPAAAGRRRRSSPSAALILVIVWHLLADPTAEYVDLGPHHYDTRAGTQRAVRNHIRGLQALGYSVTLNPAA